MTLRQVPGNVHGHHPGGRGARRAMARENRQPGTELGAVSTAAVGSRLAARLLAGGGLSGATGRIFLFFYFFSSIYQKYMWV